MQTKRERHRRSRLIARDSKVIETMKRYYKEIDALKGFAIFLVILGHGIIYFPINLHENNICAALFRFVSSVHMPLFFVVSGYCFSWNGSYKSFVWKKLRRLAVPYIVFNLLDMIPRQLVPALVNRPRSMTESLNRILLRGGELWFLYALFIVFLIYPAIDQWQRNHTWRKFVVEMLLLVLACRGTSVTLFTLNYVCYYLLYFNTGVLLKTCGVDLFGQCFRKGRVLAVAAGLFLMWMVMLYAPVRSHPILTAFVGIMFSFLATKADWFNRMFARFGGYSLQLYVMNGFTLVISRTLICKVTSDPFVILGFNVLMDFFAAYIFVKCFCERSKFLKVLMGMS